MKPAKVYDRNISFNRAFVDLGIGITGALLLSQAVYWSRRTKDEAGWFYKTGEEWEDETGLTRAEQETARRRLRELNLIDEELRGLPCKMHYRVKVDVLEALLNGGQGSLFVGTLRGSLPESGKQGRAKQPNSHAGSRRANTSTTNELPTGTTSDRERGTRIPADWSLTDELRQKAIEIGVPPGAVDTEADQFRDHWKGASGKGSTSPDWPAKWRTWCRNAVKWTYKNNPKGGTVHEQRAATIAALTGRDQQQGNVIDATAHRVD